MLNPSLPLGCSDPVFLALILELTFSIYISLSEIMRRRCDGGNRWLEHRDGKKQRSLIKIQTKQFQGGETRLYSWNRKEVSLHIMNV